VTQPTYGLENMHQKTTENELIFISMFGTLYIVWLARDARTATTYIVTDPAWIIFRIN